MTALFVALVLCADPVAGSPHVSMKSATSMCSGTVYRTFGNGSCWILTCAHGKQMGDRMTVRFDARNNEDGEVVGIDHKKDLAVVLTRHGKSRRNQQAVKILAADAEWPDLNSSVVNYGYGTDKTYLQFHERRSVIDSYYAHPTSAGEYMIRVKSSDRRGDSGGSLIQGDKLIGVTVFKIGGNIDSGYVSYRTIRKFLHEVNRNPE